MGAGVPNTLKIIMPDTTVVYNPFKGGDKEVIIEGGSATGIEYISLDYDATELVGIYERISAAISEGLLPVLIWQYIDQALHTARQKESRRIFIRVSR